MPDPAAVDPPLDRRRLCFVLGKGGAGKSTVAAALGLASAERGHRTLLVEVAAQNRLSQLLAGAGAGQRAERETQLGRNLWGISIDADRATEEYLAGQLKVRPLVEMLARSRAFHHFTSAAPGLAELVSLGKIWSMAVALRPEKDRPIWDRLIVDCPATGHGIALLETAKNVEQLAGGGPIREQAARIQQVIGHPAATGVAVVARPEELSVTEAVEATAQLRRLELPVAAAFLNGVHPHRFDDADIPPLQALAERPLHDPVGVAARASLAHLAGQVHDAAFVRRLAAESQLPVTTLPQLSHRRMELSHLRTLADHATAGARA